MFSAHTKKFLKQIFLVQQKNLLHKFFDAAVFWVIFHKNIIWKVGGEIAENRHFCQNTEKFPDFFVGGINTNGPFTLAICKELGSLF